MSELGNLALRIEFEKRARRLAPLILRVPDNLASQRGPKGSFATYRLPSVRANARPHPQWRSLL